jgi:nitrogen fixation protein FixH
MSTARRRLPGSRSAWRFFPLGLILSMFVVIVVNGGLIWSAIATFPGQSGEDGFSLSNSYDTVLNIADAEAKLGWTLDASTEGNRPVLVLVLRGADGHSFPGVRVSGYAERPVGPDERMALRFRPDATGRFVADEALPGKGQWDLVLLAEAGAQHLHATRRVLVR